MIAYLTKTEIAIISVINFLIVFFSYVYIFLNYKQILFNNKNWNKKINNKKKQFSDK